MKIKIKPFYKQHLAWEALKNNDEARTIVCYGGAAGGGKSWLGCEWLLIMCLVYPGTRWFIGREELKRLRDSTLMTFYKVCREKRLKSEVHYKYNGQDNYINIYTGNEKYPVSRVDLLALKKEPSDPLFERFGSIEYTGGWIEEAGEVTFDAYETLFTRIGRHLNGEYGLNGKLLLTCNPKKNWLYAMFYKPAVKGELEAGLHFIQSLVEENPYIPESYINGLKMISDASRKERLLYGNWEYENDPAKLIEYENIISIFTNEFVERGNSYITADIARQGRDKTVIIYWEGFRIEKIKTIEKNLITEAAEEIKKISNEKKVPMHRVYVDEDGIGGGVKDILKCKGFVANKRAVGGKNFNNAKSQAYFNLAKRIMDGELYLNDEAISKDQRERIIEELEQIKKDKVDSDGKQSVVPKDRVKEVIGRSPDYSDAMAIREYAELTTRAGFVV